MNYKDFCFPRRPKSFVILVLEKQSREILIRLCTYISTYRKMKLEIEVKLYIEHKCVNLNDMHFSNFVAQIIFLIFIEIRDYQYLTTHY